jgi:hypothetical protein
MSDIALTKAAAYAARHHLVLVEPLGSGAHGTVHVAELESKHEQSAIKAFNAREFYFRERAAYERLREAGVSEVLGFHVPQLIRLDNDLHVIEMTIVTRPFVLDFAGLTLTNARIFPRKTGPNGRRTSVNSSASGGKLLKRSWASLNNWASTCSMSRQPISLLCEPSSVKAPVLAINASNQRRGSGNLRDIP